MPRGRIVAKSISRSEKVSQLSLAGKLLFTWIIPHTDREGRLEADVWKIKDIVPFVKEITPQNIPSLLSKMDEVGLIQYYGDGNSKYLQVNDFCKYNTHPKDREAISVVPAPSEIMQSSCGDHDSCMTQVKVKDKAKVKEEREITHPPHVILSGEEVKAFETAYGKTTTKLYIDKINDYISSKGVRPYKDYAATIRNWLRRDNVKTVPAPTAPMKVEEEGGKRMTPEEFEAWKKTSPEWKKIMGRR
jgi:hypothetical protein